jgi:hypothetical protein
MKTFLKLIFVLLGAGAVVYVLSTRQEEARRVWNEVLNLVPTKECCSDECCAK